MDAYQHQYVTIGREGLSRRSFLRTASGATAGALSFSQLCGLHAAELQKQGRAMILLFMQGGPSQMETFDPKPEHENGGGTDVLWDPLESTCRHASLSIL